MVNGKWVGISRNDWCTSKCAEMGRKISETVTRSKEVAIAKKQMNFRKWADKNTKDCTVFWILQ